MSGIDTAPGQHSGADYSFRAKWNVASDDPVFAANKAALCAALELTEQQLDDVLDPYSGMPEGEMDPTT